jgi:hypothetical protein
MFRAGLGDLPPLDFVLSVYTTPPWVFEPLLSSQQTNYEANVAYENLHFQNFRIANETTNPKGI